MKPLTIRMKSADVAEILLYDQIGKDPWFGDGIGAKEFRDQIKGVKAKTINLRINSPGGSVTEAAAMMAVLDEFKGTIEVDIDGIAASAASVIAMAGDKIRMASNALMMIHDPFAGVVGGAEDMRSMADILDKIKGQILDSYLRHAKGKTSREGLVTMMGKETWFTGQEAVDAGLAHEVTDSLAMAASLDLSKFKYRNAPKPAPADVEAHNQRKARLAALNICPPMKQI